MAEREVVLGLAAEIVSAHVSNNAVPMDQLPATDPAGLQHARQRGTGICHAAQARARRSYQTINESGSPHLPGLRETVLDAEATSEDRSSTDAAGVPAALGIASIVPDGRTCLCKETIDPGEEDWVGTEEQDRQRRPQGRWLNGDDRAAPPTGSLPLPTPDGPSAVQSFFLCGRISPDGAVIGFRITTNDGGCTYFGRLILTTSNIGCSAWLIRFTG